MKQTEKVIQYVEKNGSINALQAVHELGITRISAIVYKLKGTEHALKAVPSKTAEGFVDYVPDYQRRVRFIHGNMLGQLHNGMKPYDRARVLMKATSKLLTLDTKMKQGGNK